MCSAKRHVRFTPKSRHRGSAKNPELSPEGFPATYRICQAALFRFLRRASRPSAPRPLAKRGSAAGSGVAAPKSLCQEKPDNFSLQFTRSCQVIARASASINVAGTAGEFRMLSSIIRNSARSDDKFNAQQKLEFDQWRTAIALVQRLREAGIGCELFSDLQNRN
jgi:hypothetical protein